jgi:hypothetical protein
MLLARPQQFRRTQQAADMIGTKRWARHIAHHHLPISGGGL